MHIPFFHIFYNTTFTFLSILLVTLLCITPVDQTIQAIKHRQVYDIFIIAGSHLLTFLITIFIYAGRLFANRSALAVIPKSWSPIEKGDVVERVRKLVAENLKRSAVIAYEAHPRNLEEDPAVIVTGVQNFPPKTPSEAARQQLSGLVPAWGTISHPGWSSPSSPALPNLHFDPIILELPHLIEAKAVSLAPADRLFIPASQDDGPESSNPPLPDALAVELLQRPATMGLRDYISHLTSLAMIHPSALGSSFLAIYEKARFSGKPLHEEEFRALMNIFAEILRGMTVLDLDIVAGLHAEQDALSNDVESAAGDADSLITSATVEYTPRPDTYPSDASSTTSSSRRSQATARTAQSLPRATHTDISSVNRTPRHHGGIHTPSSSSLRSRASSGFTQRSGGSVIRLSEARGLLDLPYTILTASSTREDV